MNHARLVALLIFLSFVVGLSILDRPAAITARASITSPTTLPIDFTRQIQPILADNCYICHGPDAAQRKADLRLDTLDPHIGPFAKRDGYEILAPGNLDDSILIMRVTSDEADVKMPPPTSHRHLTPPQIELIKQWVEQGAKWAKHWSLIPPTRPALPKVGDSKWARNEIDDFILARLEKEGLKPSPEAPKETLIRRVTLDLTGLPPTPDEIDAFVADTSADAYEKVVDRLLSSPRYGEHMAWSWLELARYADTNGYQADPTRTLWPWRDWVVKAINENMPYDRFVTWQLAGDLLPDATQEQRMASAFNRNHPYNGEGGRIAEETRVENVFDRTDTTGVAFLGLTVGCAKCHDHKYDPISQKEYYQLSAYFNNCSETGELKYTNMGNVAPVMKYVTPEDATKLVSLEKAVRAAEEKLATESPKIDAAQAKWEESARYEKGWILATPVSAKSKNDAYMQTLPDSSILVSGWEPEIDVYDITLRTDLPRITAIRIEPLPDPSLPQDGPGRFEESGNFVLTQIEAKANPLDKPKQSKKLSFSTADATFSQDQLPVANAIDSDPKSGWAVWKAPDKSNLSAIFRFNQPVSFSAGASAPVVSLLHLKLHFESIHKFHNLGRFRLYVTDGSAPTPQVASALALSPSQRTDAHEQQLRDFFRTRTSGEFNPLQGAVASAKQTLTDFDNKLARVMVMDDATKRQSKILTKGAYDKPTDLVSAALPTALLSLSPSVKTPAVSTAPTSQPSQNRLDLAHYLFSPENPLTARVTVNRIWQNFFGIGLVKTPDDFGLQGERPSHPELLDYLAVEFRDSKWDIKSLHKLLVTSATYRQSSKSTPAQNEKDPDNRLLSRAPRYRLSSAALRDQALFASGLLVEKLYGPPVNPYQPPGVWEEATFGFIKYKPDTGDALYRRTLYTFWRRIVGPTNLFDAPARTTCTVRPTRTNSPLHALTTLNDPTYIEAARALAQRIMLTSDSPESRLTMAFKLVLSRTPTAEEQSLLLTSLNRLKSQFAADKSAAEKLLAIGDSKRNDKLNAVDHAAYTSLSLTLLNLDETLCKQ